ncbi:MAG: UPF0280 family protein [Desulfarculaceae bacterium]|nr:UPF0280 family protein [Desulfarculaceae bacterium]
MFENRRYRSRALKEGLVSFTVTVKETNLHIQADSDLTEPATRAVLSCRNRIESYIREYPQFAASLTPLPEDPFAPALINDMIRAGQAAGTGPMAAIAGAVAEYAGGNLLDLTGRAIVENGGDIFIRSDTDTVCTIHAGKSPLSMKTGILIKKREVPFALCTSSGTLGHSKSFGKADAVTVLSGSTPLADAAATGLCNMVHKERDIDKVIEKGKTIPGVEGLAIIKGKHIGLWGNLQVVKL